MKQTLWIVALLCSGLLMSAERAAATSNIATEFASFYGINLGSCSDCHSGSTSANTFVSGWPTSINTYFDSPLGVALSPYLDTDIAIAMAAVEPEYAPTVLLANRLQYVAGNAVSAVIPIDPGKLFNGNGASLSSLGGSWDVDQGAVAKTGAQNSATATFTNNSSIWLTRGNRRRANILANGSCDAASPDYTLTLSPINSASFDANGQATIQANTVGFCFENIPPEPGSVTKTVNVFESTSTVTLAGGGLASNVLSDSPADSDPDGNPATALEAVLETAPAASGFTLNSDGSYSYQADAYSVRTTDSFQYKIKDSETGISTQTVTVSISIIENVPGNNAPSAEDDVATVAEDATDVSVNVLINDSDVDLDAFQVTGIGTITGPGSAVVAADGSAVLVTPDTNSDAPFTVVYQISDEHGSPASANLVVSVTGSPDDPIATPITVAPNPVDTDPAFSINLLDPAFVSDPDSGATLSVVETSLTVTILNAIELAIPAGFDDSFAVSAGAITFDPARFDFVDQSQQAELEIAYTVADETGRMVINKVVATVIGTPNDPLRIPGQYSDSLSSRYNNNFENGSAAPGACLSCHLPDRTEFKVDLDCTTSQGAFTQEPVFNSFGLAICLARDPAKEALSNLVERLSEQENTFAPSLASIANLAIDEDLGLGASILTASAASAGLNVFGAPTTIVTYLLNDNGAYSGTAHSGMFSVDSSGQLSVASALTPGTYQIDIRPVNDAAQQDNNAVVRAGIPGFFPVRESLVLPKIFMLTVNAVPIIAVADTASVEQGSGVLIDVGANDTGGTIDSVAISGGQPANGTAVVNGADNTITYTPTAGFTGVDTFLYSAENATGVSNAATVSVTVVAAGGLVAIDDAKSAIPAIVTNIDVLANDGNAILASANPAGATVVTLIAGSEPDPATVGTFSVSGQNVTFTPVPTFTSGAASIQYRGTNPLVSGVSSSTATITVTMVEFDPASGIGASAVPELAAMASSFIESCTYAAGNGTPGAELSRFLNVCVDIQTAIDNSEDVDQALRALRNEEHFAALDSTQMIARGLGNVVQGRIAKIQRGDVRGLDLSAIAVSVDGVQIPSRSIQDLGAYLLGQPESGSSDIYSGETPWGLFVAGEFAIGKKDPSDTASGFELVSNNLMVGLDYRINANKVVGFAGGYAASDVDFGDGGSMRGQGLQLSAFGTLDNFTRPGLQLDGYVSIGRVAFDSDRAINFTSNGVTVDEIASASFNSTYLNLAPRVSYSNILGEYGDPLGDFETDLQLTVFGALDYLFTYINGYTETGGSGLNLNVKGQGYHSLIASFGVEADRTLYLGQNTKFQLFGGVSLNGAFLDDIRSVTSSFVAAGAGAPEFTISEPGTSGFYWAADIGGSIDIGAGNLTVAYGLEQQTSDGLGIQRLSLHFVTPIGRSGQLNFGANQTASASSRSWITEVGYSQEF